MALQVAIHAACNERDMSSIEDDCALFRLSAEDADARLKMRNG